MSRQPARQPRVLYLMRDVTPQRGVPLWSLMGLIALLALAFAGVLYPLGRAREADRAVAPIRAVGGDVAEAWNWSDRLRGPGGLHRVSFAKGALDDEGLGRLTGPLLRLPEITLLKLDDNAITDEGLAHLRALNGHRHLRVLSLRRSKVTDAGLVHLRDLTQLRHLNLLETGVTARGARELKEYLPDTMIVAAGYEG
jgi:hypothetical protein